VDGRELNDWQGYVVEASSARSRREEFVEAARYTFDPGGAGAVASAAVGVPPSTASVFDPHSPQARAISSLFAQTLTVCALIGLLVTVLVATCVVRFRAGARHGTPIQTHGNSRLEMGWTLGPLAIVLGLFALTTHAMAESDPQATRDPDLIVVGHQWWWEARYPSGVVTANEIHVPAGKDLLVRIESDDVIHDFWVPQLGRKMDAIPGHPASIWMQADTPGTYPGACAEYCGSQHAWMRISVVAQTQAEFDAWQKHELEPAQPATVGAPARGAAIFQNKTCIRCHAIHGLGDVRIAPDLTHLAERSTLGAGVIGNNPDDLAKWLREPQTVKPGSHMPDLNLTDDEISDLVAYFETLR
jgi:cytochrome c oxidase subunit 2